MLSGHDQAHIRVIHYSDYPGLNETSSASSREDPQVTALNRTSRTFEPRGS